MIRRMTDKFCAKLDHTCNKSEKMFHAFTDRLRESMQTVQTHKSQSSTFLLHALSSAHIRKLIWLVAVRMGLSEWENVRICWSLWCEFVEWMETCTTGSLVWWDHVKSKIISKLLRDVNLMASENWGWVTRAIVKWWNAYRLDCCRRFLMYSYALKQERTRLRQDCEFIEWLTCDLG